MTAPPVHPEAAELARVPLLATLTGTELEELSRHLEVEPFRPGEVLVREGAYGFAFYVLRDGEVEVRHDATVVTRLGRHDFFGERALLGDGHRVATVVGVEPGTVWCMFGTTFRVLEAEHPEIAAVINAF